MSILNHQGDETESVQAPEEKLTRFESWIILRVGITKKLYVRETVYITAKK